MASDKQVERIAGGLGLITLGAGTSFTVLPNLFGRALGLSKNSAQEGGSQLVVRALGFRDIAFALGLIFTRKQPKAARQWLRLFTVCMLGDVLACVAAYRKPGRSITQLLGGAASAVFGWLAWNAGQERN